MSADENSFESRYLAALNKPWSEWDNHGQVVWVNRTLSEPKFRPAHKGYPGHPISRASSVEEFICSMWEIAFDLDELRAKAGLPKKP